MQPTLIKGLASFLLLGMAVLQILSVVWPQIPVWLSGLCGWVAFLLLLILEPKQFRLFLVLAGIGLLLLVWGWSLGSSPSLEKILQQNNVLIVMLYCISYLKLLTAPMKSTDKGLPTGRLSAVKTLLGIHLLGAVINASVFVVIADRFKKAEAVNQRTITLVSRAYSMAAFWSPFFGAMAVALTYSPEAKLSSLMAAGIPLMMVGMLYTLIDLGGYKLNKLRDFRGYPMKAESLWVPALLAGSVILGHQLWPEVPILVIISMAAILLTAVFLILKRSEETSQQFHQYVVNSAPLMSRELGLFLGAGVLSIGAQSVLVSFGDFHPFTNVSGVLLSMLLAAGIAISIIGIHPVVSISVLGPFLSPLEVDPNLLAVFFLCMWSLGTVASPFSGMSAIVSSQFEVPRESLFRWNIRYVLVMWLLVSGAFILW